MQPQSTLRLLPLSAIRADVLPATSLYHEASQRSMQKKEILRPGRLKPRKAGGGLPSPAQCLPDPDPVSFYLCQAILHKPESKPPLYCARFHL